MVDDETVEVRRWKNTASLYGAVDSLVDDALNIVRASERPEYTDSNRLDTLMAKHDIEISIPAATVKNKDVEVGVRSDKKPLGTVKISKGTIDWLPSPNSKTHFRLTWEQFDDMMRKNGKS